jgi:hypothetical protein
MHCEDRQSCCRRYGRVKACSGRHAGSAEGYEKNVIGLQGYIGSLRMMRTPPIFAV